MLPPAACTVTAPVCGADEVLAILGLLLAAGLPPQLILTATMQNNTKASRTLYCVRLAFPKKNRELSRRRPGMPSSNPQANRRKPASNRRPKPVNLPGSRRRALWAAAVTVRVIEPLALSDAGLTEHVVPGSVEATLHVKFTVFLKPLIAVRSTVAAPEAPELSVKLGVEIISWKSGVAAVVDDTEAHSVATLKALIDPRPLARSYPGPAA